MASYKVIKINGVAISTGNTKLGAIPSVSLAPWLSCHRNGPRDCTRACYARKLARLRKNVSNSWESNANIWAHNPSCYFDAIKKFLYTTNVPRFRWHVAGDIPDIAYFNNMRDIAESFGGVHFLAFTKSYNIMALPDLAIPKNLTIRVSAWPGLQWALNKGVMLKRGYPIAWVSQLKEAGAGYTDTIPSDAVACPGCCDNCDRCWANDAQHVVFKAH